MSQVITLTPQHAAVYRQDETGCKQMLNCIPLSALRPPKGSAVGRTGQQIRWSAYPTATVTLDTRSSK